LYIITQMNFLECAKTCERIWILILFICISHESVKLSLSCCTSIEVQVLNYYLLLFSIYLFTSLLQCPSVKLLCPRNLQNVVTCVWRDIKKYASMPIPCNEIWVNIRIFSSLQDKHRTTEKHLKIRKYLFIRKIKVYRFKQNNLAWIWPTVRMDDTDCQCKYMVIS
jgi:hypothetical protein